MIGRTNDWMLVNNFGQQKKSFTYFFSNSITYSPKIVKVLRARRIALSFSNDGNKWFCIQFQVFLIFVYNIIKYDRNPDFPKLRP